MSLSLLPSVYFSSTQQNRLWNSACVQDELGYMQ